MEIIQVEGLCKAYGSLQAVKDLSFCVKRGQVFGLLGANGAGKSTAIECMLGTKKPDEGRVRILGLDPRRQRKALFQQVGVQFQEASCQENIRVGELCEATAALYRSTANAGELLAWFGLAEKAGKPVSELSGGQKQRLFIVLALLPNPSVVFLDELTTGLDAKARRDVWRYLTQLKAQGLTILLTSHFMDEVEALCDEICVLRSGAAVFKGSVAEAREQTGCATLEQAYLHLTGEELIDESV